MQYEIFKTYISNRLTRSAIDGASKDLGCDPDKLWKSYKAIPPEVLRKETIREMLSGELAETSTEESLHEVRMARWQQRAISEFDWEDRGRTTYFISNRVADLISHSKFDVRMEELKFRHRAFSVSFCGYPKLATGLVSILNRSERDEIYKRACLYSGTENPQPLGRVAMMTKFYRAAEDVFGEDELHRREDDTSLLPEAIRMIDPSRYIISPERLVAFQFGQSGHFEDMDTGELIEVDRAGEFERYEKVDAAEYFCAFNTFTFSMRLLAYIQTFPESLVAGAPPHKAMTSRHRGESFSVGLPERFKNSPSTHLRGGHFRTYRDERYTRNPDGSCKIGYVNPAIIGKGIDAHHVNAFAGRIERRD